MAWSKDNGSQSAVNAAQYIDGKKPLIEQAIVDANEAKPIAASAKAESGQAKVTAGQADTKATDALAKATSAKTTAETVQGEFDRVVAEAGSNNPEVVQARGSEVTLKARLDKTTAQLAETATKQQLQQVSLSFKESYADLTALQTAYPSGNVYNHAVLSDGMIYTYTGSAWTSTGIQANGTGLTDGVVTINKTSFLKMGKNHFNKEATIKDAYLSPSGKLVSSTTYQTSELIPVTPGNWNVNACRHCIIYDDTTTFAKYYDNPSSGNLNIVVEKNGYMRVDATNSKVLTLQVEKGIVVTPYEAYRLELPYLTQPLQPQVKALEDKMVNLEAVVAGTTGDITVTKSGETFTIKSKFDDQKDIELQTIRNGTWNGTFKLQSTTLGSEVIHDISDDVTPIRTNISTLGANHGYTNVVVVTMTSHGKTNADLGSQWTDGTTVYTLLIVLANELTFGVPYTVLNEIVSAPRVLPVANLTHVSDATNTTSVNISNLTARQELFPSVNNKSVRYLIDGKEIAVDGVYIGNELQVQESYNIMDYKAIVDFAKANIGQSYNNESIEGIIRLSINYKFTKGCDCFISHSLKALKKATVGECGFLQSKMITLPNHTTKRYMPNVLENGGYDFKNIVDMTNFNTNLTYYNGSLIDVNLPPNRVTDLLYNGSTLKAGFTIGYIGDKTDSKHARRVVNATKKWDMRNTKKIYPIAIKDLTLNAGAYMTFMGYRNYIAPTDLKNKATNLTLVRDKKDVYVYLDYHVSSIGKNIELPNDIGKSITVIESEGFTLLNDVVDVNGITFNTNSYGYAILKLN